MYYLSLNDASMFELVDLVEETKTKLKGETLSAISMQIQNADVELIRTAFSSEFNTRTVTVMSENKIAMTVYNAYTILRSIATDEQSLQDSSAKPIYTVVLAQPTDIGDLVPMLQARIEELETQVIALTAEPDPATMDLTTLKKYLIGESKKNLEKYLNENPVKSSCHGDKEALYTCTLEKQTLLNNAIAMCSIHDALGNTYTPSWNAHGEECTFDWTKDELVRLAIDLEAVVKPLISAQQSMEKKINDAVTKEEVMAVSITFPPVTNIV